MRSIAALVFALATSAGTHALQVLQLQPKTYVSPSGRWSLRVEPTERREPKRATCEMTCDGERAWRMRLPFALWKAAVTDDGRVAGVTYSGNVRDGGSLRVVLLSPGGQVLFDEPHERVSSGVSHTSPLPVAQLVFVQPELERFVVQVGDREREGLRCQYDACWVYDLRTGASLSQHRLERAPQVPDLYLRDGRPVPATPLTLLHWLREDYSQEPWSRGGVFELVDEDWNVVWTLELPHDYEVPGDKLAEEALEADLLENGILLSTGPSQFELRFVAEGQRVRFAVERSGSSWMVRETGRTTFVEPEIRVFRPTLLSRIHLGGARNEPPSDRLENPGNARLDVTSGRILIQDRRSDAIHVFDLEGRELLICRPEPDQLEDARQMFCDADGRVFAARSPYHTRYLRFAPDGTNEGFHEGEQGLWTHTRTAVLFQEGSGKTSVDLEKRPDGAWFRSVQDIALASDRSLAVLDIAETDWSARAERGPPFVSLFDPRGESRRALPLPEDIEPRELVFGGKHVVVTDGKETHLLDVETGEVLALDFEEWLEPPGRRREIALSSDGSEVWVVSAFEREFLRFALTE